MTWLPKGGIIRRLIEDYWKDEHVSILKLDGKESLLIYICTYIDQIRL